MAKGASFEREISRMLSLWWTGSRRDDVFWRTHGSGARATSRRKRGKRTAYQYGDITFTHPIGKALIDFSLISLKRGYTKELDTLIFVDRIERIYKRYPMLLKWWHEAEDERRYAKRPQSIVIFKRDRHLHCIMMDYKLFQRLQTYNGVWNTNAEIGKSNMLIITMSDGLQLVIVPFLLFLDWCHPNVIRKMKTKPKLVLRKTKERRNTTWKFKPLLVT